MSPMFSHKDEEKQDNDKTWGPEALQAEFDRLNSMPLRQLAAEVMSKGFGRGGPGADDEDVWVGGASRHRGRVAGGIANQFMAARGVSSPLGSGVVMGAVAGSPDIELQQRIVRLVAEGLQELEHASLVRAQMHEPGNGLDYAITRRGRVALERGEVEGILAAAGA